jgi:hypothetical protein
MTADPEVIRERSVKYARLQADALPVEESYDLIADLHQLTSRVTELPASP